ncbi:MAG: TetR/AcrR family transcriptional regulator [Luteibaculum sp.]
MEETQQQILDQARGMFFARGFRSVSLDEIARETKVSKKTIYKYYKDKTALVEAVVSGHLGCMQDKICHISTEQENAIAEIMHLAQTLISFKQQVNPAVFYDLEKFHASVYELVKKHRDDFVKRLIMKNIERGKQEGFYRQEIHPEFTAGLYLLATNEIMTNRIIPADLTAGKALEKFFNYHLHGMVTDKGLQLLNKSQFTLSI